MVLAISICDQYVNIYVVNILCYNAPICLNIEIIKGFMMIKIVLFVLCSLMPYTVFADVSRNEDAQANWYQEQCAKEKDPIKRQQYCHKLDQYQQSQMNKNYSFEDVWVV